MKRILFMLLLLCPLTGFGQATIGYHRVNQILARAPQTVAAQVVPYAKVYVTVTATGLAATIYSDPLLSEKITPSVVTADLNGNYSYYIPLSYLVTETISSPGQGNLVIPNIGENSAAAIITAFASPPPIGNVAPNTGSFTTLSATAGIFTAAQIAALGNITPGTGSFTTLTASGTIAATTTNVSGTGTFGSIAATGVSAPYIANTDMRGFPQSLLGFTPSLVTNITHDSASWDAYGLGSPSNTLFLKGVYWLCNGGYSTSSVSSGQAFGCYSAPSLLGTWTPATNPVFSNTSPPSWAAACIEGPMLWTDGVTVYMSYNGYPSACDSFGTGAIGIVSTSVANFPYGWSAQTSSPLISLPSQLQWLYRPDIIEYNGTFYDFSNAGDLSGHPVIAEFTAPAITGPWTYYSTVVTETPSETGGELNEPEVWHDPSGMWIMSFGVEVSGTISYATSPDLVNWTQIGVLVSMNVPSPYLPRIARDAEGNYFLMANNNTTAGTTIVSSSLRAVPTTGASETFYNYVTSNYPGGQFTVRGNGGTYDFNVQNSSGLLNNFLVDDHGNGTFAGILGINVANGTAPIAVSSSTPVLNLVVQKHPLLYSCNGSTTCGNVLETSPKVFFDSINMSGTNMSITGMSPPFTSQYTFSCSCGVTVGTCNAYPASSSSVSLNNTATSGVLYLSCIGY